MSGDATESRAAVWLRDGESDLAIASVKKTRKIRYEHLCFHAQQAAEKAITMACETVNWAKALVKR